MIMDFTKSNKWKAIGSKCDNDVVKGLYDAIETMERQIIEICSALDMTRDDQINYSMELFRELTRRL